VQTQGSPGRRSGPTSRKLCLPKARVPLEASRNVLPTRAGGLGPHQAHTGRDARSPGSPRRRAAPPRPLSPPRREGAPRLPPRRGGCCDSEEDRSPRLNRQVRGSSAGPYDGRRSRPGSEPRLPSPSTQGRQGRSCGLRITDWHASWEGRMTTTSSSATSPFSSPTLPGHGWSICLLRRSPTGTTWSRPSRETSKVRTCALGTHGTSKAAASSQGNPSESPSDDFQSSAPSCPTSPTRTSSGHSSPAPRAGTW
jgi:hypothetical protein